MDVSTLKPRDLPDTEADTAVVDMDTAMETADTAHTAVETADTAVETVDTAVDILTAIALMLEIVDMGQGKVADPDMEDMDADLDMVTDSAVYVKPKLNDVLTTMTATFTFRGLIVKKTTCSKNACSAECVKYNKKLMMKIMNSFLVGHLYKMGVNINNITLTRGGYSISPRGGFFVMDWWYLNAIE